MCCQFYQCTSIDFSKCFSFSFFLYHKTRLIFLITNSLLQLFIRFTVQPTTFQTHRHMRLSYPLSRLFVTAFFQTLFIKRTFVTKTVLYYLIQIKYENKVIYKLWMEFMRHLHFKTSFILFFSFQIPQKMKIDFFTFYTQQSKGQGSLLQPTIHFSKR